MDFRNCIENILNSWNVCKNNQYIVEKLYYKSLVFDTDTDIKKTIIIDNCSKLDIDIMTKLNHILILNSEHVTININGGLISGITIIHSKHVNVKISNNKIDFSEISDSENCNFIYDLESCNNSYINTNLCYNINFIVSDDNIYNKFITNQSLFGGHDMYYFDNDILNKIRYINDEMYVIS